MKNAFLVAAVVALSSGMASAQTAPAYKINMGKAALESQPTPQISATNIIDKRWKPKFWIEIDTEFKIKLPVTDGPDATLPSLELKYFMVTTGMSKDGRRIVLKGTVTYTNIPGDQEVHALAFVSPATLKSALRKEGGSKADIVAMAVVAGAGEDKNAVFTQGPGVGKWWEELDATKFEVVDGGVLPKNKTPFAPFWGDYDLVPQAN